MNLSYSQSLLRSDNKNLVNDIVFCTSNCKFVQLMILKGYYNTFFHKCFCIYKYKPILPYSVLTLDQSYGYGEHRQLPIFHHEEAHQPKTDAMNFRHSVIMATRSKPKTITKAEFSQTGRNSTKSLSKLNHTTRMIAVVNSINCYLPICYIHKEKGDTYLGEIRHGKHNRNPVRDVVYPTNMTTKIYF